MKKIAIIYASKHGTTEKVAQLLAEKINGEVALISLTHIAHHELSFPWQSALCFF